MSDSGTLVKKLSYLRVEHRFLIYDMMMAEWSEKVPGAPPMPTVNLQIIKSDTSQQETHIRNYETELNRVRQAFTTWCNLYLKK